MLMPRRSRHILISIHCVSAKVKHKLHVHYKLKVIKCKLTHVENLGEANSGV